MLTFVNVLGVFINVLRYKQEGHGVDSQWGLWDFTLIFSFLLYYNPGVDSASNRKEYQAFLIGGKGGRCLWLTTLPYLYAACLAILGAYLGLYRDSFTNQCTVWTKTVPAFTVRCSVIKNARQKAGKWRKSVSRWQVAGPSGFLLTPSKQSG